MVDVHCVGSLDLYEFFLGKLIEDLPEGGTRQVHFVIAVQFNIVAFRSDPFQLIEPYLDKQVVLLHEYTVLDRGAAVVLKNLCCLYIS